MEEVEASGLRCEPWYQDTRAPQPWALVPGHFFIYLFFWAEVHFFQGLDEVDFFDESLSSLVPQDLDKSLSSLSRLG